MYRLVWLTIWIGVAIVASRAIAQPPTVSPSLATPPINVAQYPATGLGSGYAGAVGSAPVEVLSPGGPLPRSVVTPGGPAGPDDGRSPYLDLDAYLSPGSNGRDCDDEWGWQLLPSSLIYKSYLAGTKESRLASQHINIKEDGWLWDAVLGARVGLLRFGNYDPVRPDGFQIDAEGSAQIRLDVTDDVNLRSGDYRGGLPLTYGAGRFRTKFGYYHLSSHLGDEFLLANLGYPRLNYSRDCLVLGETIFLTDRLRVYGEMAWAFHNDVCDPWEFQFGVDYAPVAPTGFIGEPFFAINGHLRQELNYSGNLVVQVGWAWVSDQNGRLLRIGFDYFNGLSNQYSFYNQFEQQIGMGLWYDF